MVRKSEKRIGNIVRETEFRFNVLSNILMKSIKIHCFPDIVREEIITAIYKKDNLLGKSCYGVINMFKVISARATVFKMHHLTHSTFKKRS